MIYAAFGTIAFIVMLIINFDVLFKRTSGKLVSSNKPYRKFLFGISFYYITDILWGVLDEYHVMAPLYADTVFYFVAMGLSILLWTNYAVNYFNEKTLFGKGLLYAGYVFMLTEIVALIVNFFSPVVFYYDDNDVYATGFFRHVVLMMQILLFLFTSVYLFTQVKKAPVEKKLRYITIGIFGIVMIIFILIQVYFPLMPLYAIGCMLGTCLLHTFVLEDEKAEYQRKLEELLRREKEQKRELGSARQLAYTDPLTGVKNRHAYLEATDRLDSGIEDGTVREFGIIVCDINGLKKINDTYGHEEGDRYICEGCMLICRKFTHSPVFRIGGDEFAVLLEGTDYTDRISLLASFDRKIEQNIISGEIILSTGMDEFDPSADTSFAAVFERADKKMYERKKYLKSKTPK